MHSHVKPKPAQKRNRRWERKHQQSKVVYRGVDPRLALHVVRIAETLGLTTGKVAQCLLTFALRAYQADELDLFTYWDPKRRRLTLKRRTYVEQVKTALSKAPKRVEQGCRVVTTWRGFPADLKRQLSNLASIEQLNVPQGELITALLRFSLRAYEADWLKLPATPTTAVEGEA